MRTFEKLREQYKISPLEALTLTDAELEETRTKIVGFIKEHVPNKAIIGLSGGVDSALVAYLAVEALGKENVHGIMLPSNSNTSEDYELGKLVAENLGMKYDVINIQGTVDAFKKASPYFESKLSQGNLKARIRMTELYGAANELDARVVGTDNLSENKIGYFTKFGDGGVDSNPIEHIYKTQVWQLSRKVGVPEQIVNRAPTAGLWQGQTDEGEIGVTYKLLDQVLLGLSLEYSPNEVAGILKIDQTIVDMIIKKNTDSQHKREMPPYPKVMPYD